MHPKKIKKISNQYYLKYYMIKAGNDNPKLKEEVNVLKELLAKLKI
jgi:hypothetical protein